MKCAPLFVRRSEVSLATNCDFDNTLSLQEDIINSPSQIDNRVSTRAMGRKTPAECKATIERVREVLGGAKNPKRDENTLGVY